MTFNRPQTGGGDVFKPQEHANELVLVWPRDMRYNVNTPTGVSDAMACDIVVLDGPAAGQKYVNTLLFSVGLRNNLQSYLGDPNPALGRILHVALAGGKTTWNLADYSDADAALAASYLQHNPHHVAAVQQTPPPQQQQAPQGSGWGAPAPEPVPSHHGSQTQAQAAAAFRGDPALAAPPEVQANTWGAPAPANAWAQPAAAPAAAGAPPAWAAPAAAAPAPQATPPAYAPPVAAAAPAAAPAAWNAVDVQAAIRQGLADQDIAAATGAPLQAVAAIRAAGPQG